MPHANNLSWQTPESMSTSPDFATNFRLVPPPLRSDCLNSPFRFPGGKFYARNLVLREIPDHSVYCEPFAGGASIFFAKQLSERSILNDLDSEIMNAFRQIRDRAEDLIRLLDGVSATRGNHNRIKNEYEPSNELERAFRWFYLNRTSYSGIMRPENCYWGYRDKHSMPPDRWPALLRIASEKLQDVELMAMDFESLIDALPDGCFLFVDPPYYAADQKKFYPCSFVEGDHRRLTDCLRRNSARISFLLTYDDCPEIRGMYSWADSISERQWIYALDRTDDQKNGVNFEDGFRGARKRGRELFIRNY